PPCTLIDLLPCPDSYTPTPPNPLHLPPVPLPSLHMGGDVVSEPLVGGRHTGGETGAEGDVVSEPLVGGCHSGGGEAGDEGAGASLVSHLACTLTLLFSLQPFPSVTLTPTLAFHLPPVPLSALYLGGDVVSEPLVGGCHSGGGEAGDEGAGASLLSRLACTLTLLYSLQPFPSVTLTETLAFHLPPVPLSALYLGGDVVSEPLVGGCHRGGAAGDEGAGAVRTAGDSGGRMGDER
ncbi:unnamed protein product, partial [Closterium sp. NIES-54]